MTIIKQLITIWNYRINYNIQYNILEMLIPKIWQVILMSDGSFTRNISILNNTNIKINLIREKEKSLSSTKCINYFYPRKSNMTREVWLINNKRKIVFAESAWQIQKAIVSSFSNKIPIGKNLITSEVNIHRELESIYLCYSAEVEKNLKCKGPLWGRSYKIYFDKKSVIIINEIFTLNHQKFIPSIKIN